MTGTQLNALINLKCGTNNTTFTPADKLVYVNAFKDELASMIVETNSNFFLVPSTFNLVADQREYAIGDDLLNRIKKLELKFSSGDARQPSINIKDYLGSETESEIVLNYGNAKGQFAHTIRRRALFILSGTIVSVTGGGRIWATIFPADLANLTGVVGLEVDPSTTSFGFPRQFHELLARRVAIEYKGNKTKPIPLSQTEQNYENDLSRALAALTTQDESAEVLGELPNAEDLYNYGWDT